jgi:uncharacterized protein (DUF952 family)
VIYHVTTAGEWAAYANRDHYAPSAFGRDGFIHACHLHQLDGVLQRYFAGQTDLLLLFIDEQKLTCQLRNEPATGGEVFPHVFGEINKTAVVRLEVL